MFNMSPFPGRALGTRLDQDGGAAKSELFADAIGQMAHESLPVFRLLGSVGLDHVAHRDSDCLNSVAPLAQFFSAASRCPGKDSRRLLTHRDGIVPSFIQTSTALRLQRRQVVKALL